MEGGRKTQRERPWTPATSRRQTAPGIGQQVTGPREAIDDRLRATPARAETHQVTIPVGASDNRLRVRERSSRMRRGGGGCPSWSWRMMSTLA